MLAIDSRVLMWLPRVTAMRFFMMNLQKILLAAMAVGSAIFAPLHAQSPKALKALLVTGGCCHDYAKQKDLLKEGLEKRLNIVVEHAYSEDRGTSLEFDLYKKTDWAKGYDIVIHDECWASVKNVPFVQGILAPHKEGIPAINLHCAAHCYRVGNPGTPQTTGTTESMWFDFLGLQSSGHGPQAPISITFIDKSHPVTKGMSNWVTEKEELYNKVKVHDSAIPLARGKQDASAFKMENDQIGRNDCVLVWANVYGDKKTRVFSTTLGHNNVTVGDDRYLDLVARGILWATDKIEADGKAKEGFGK